MSSDHTKSESNSPIVISSSDDDYHSNQNDSRSVISVEDGSTESDCEIMNVEELRREEKWRPRHSVFKRLNSLIQAGFNNPRTLLTQVFGLDDNSLPSDLHHLWSLLLTLLAEPAPRHRLRHINSLEHVLQLMSSANSILVITGAGISVSCGIPDFRSRDGIYARLSRDYPDLSNPQAMFDMSYFRKNPVPFFKFAKELFPGQFTPSLTHRLIAFLESKGKLLRNYTQNIDTLEQVAGITRLIQCHGSFASATCTTCKHKVLCEDIRESVFSQSIPHCPICWSKESTSVSKETVQSDGNEHDNEILNFNSDEDYPESNPIYGVLKPDIVFFGEGLSNEFHDTLAEDVNNADLAIVMGSSLKVRPVAHIPHALSSHVPQILINREPLSNHDFDVELLGDCDVVVAELCHRLEWHIDGLEKHNPLTEVPLNTLKDNNSTTPHPKESVPDSLPSKSVNVVLESNGDQSASEFVVNISPECSALLDESETSLCNNSMGTGFSKEINKDVDSDKNGNYDARDDKDCNNNNDGDSNSADEDTTKDDEKEDSIWEVSSTLPPNSFTRIHPNQYVFPGAEIYLDNTDELNCSCSSHTDSSDSSFHEADISNDQSGNLFDSNNGNDDNDVRESAEEKSDVDTELNEVAEPQSSKRPHCKSPDNSTSESSKHSRLL